MAKWDAYYPDCIKKCGNKTSHKSGLCGDCRTKPCKKCKTPAKLADIYCAKCKSNIRSNKARKDALSVSGVFLK